MGEEQKTKIEKSTKVEAKQPQISYDDLKTLCTQLTQQNRMLVTELNKVNNLNLFKRLDYLFMIVGNSDKFGDFSETCKKEIVDILTIEGIEQEDCEQVENGK